MIFLFDKNIFYKVLKEQCSVSIHSPLPVRRNQAADARWTSQPDWQPLAHRAVLQQPLALSARGQTVK